MNAKKMFAHDVQPAFGQQKMDIGDPTVLRILDRNDCAPRAPIGHRIERILERKARQRQAIGRGFQRGAVRIGARRALKGDGA